MKALILSIIFVLVLGGCWPSRVTTAMIDKANEVCEKNEGLSHIYVNSSLATFMINCKNGASFTFEEEKINNREKVK